MEHLRYHRQYHRFSTPRFHLVRLLLLAHRLRYSQQVITPFISHTSFGGCLLVFLYSFFLNFLWSWYLLYRNAHHLKCCFCFGSSFWSSGSVVKTESRSGERVRARGIDNREQDAKNSSKNHSIIFSYTTMVFQTCTAVKELHMEIKPNQVFTLLGPVLFLLFPSPTERLR